MMPRSPPMLPTMVTMTPRMMQIQQAQKCQFPMPGFFSTSQMTEGNQKVVGPVPRAPMNPIRSPAVDKHSCEPEPVSGSI